MIKNYSFLNDLFEFSNKNIVVLGGAKGIGRDISNKLYLLKANVIVISRTLPAGFNKNINFYKCDISNENQLKNSFLSIFKKYKKIYSIINCVSITLPANKKLQSFENFKKTIDTNLISYYNVILHCSKKLESGGSLVNISSIYANLAFPNNPSYISSKAAINGLTRSLAYDLSEKKIRVNSVSAGYIKSNMTKKTYSNLRKRKKIDSHNLLNRWGRIDEISFPVIFLISKASSFINGQDIVVDGGWTIKGII